MFRVFVPSAVAFTAAALGAACARFDPPAVYQTWWAMVEECSGIQKPFERIRWFVERDARYDGGARGAWYQFGNAIVLSANGRFSGGLVRHEMLHALVDAARHPREYFVVRCSGVVDCEFKCALEDGRVPPVSSRLRRLAPNELSLTASLTPKSPSLSARDGTFMFTIAVTNTTSD